MHYLDVEMNANPSEFLKYEITRRHVNVICEIGKLLGNNKNAIISKERKISTRRRANDYTNV